MAKINTRNELDPRTLENSWKLPVLSSIANPPVSPNNGDRHRIIATATGVFSGKENQIAIYDANNETWFFETYGEGSIVYDLDANDYRYVKPDGSWEQFDKIPLAISDVTGLQSALDAKEPTTSHDADVTTLTNSIATKEPLLPSKTGNSLKFLRVNVSEDGFEFSAVAGGQTTFTDTEFDIHDEADATKILKIDVGTLIATGTTRTQKAQNANGTLALLETAQTFIETLTSSKVGDVLIPSVDNQGNIGSASKRFASIRGVLIQSGDLILTDKKTGKKLYKLHEDKTGIYFSTIRGKKLMKITNKGDLLISGKIREGAKF